MKTSDFRRGDALWVKYRKPREGPPSYLVYVPPASFICMTGSDVLKAVKWPKYTATGLALREWLETIEENTQQEPEIEPAKMNTEGFGPDATREPD